MSDYEKRAANILGRIEELAAISEQPGMVTRTYGSPAFLLAANKVFAWMHAAGLETVRDNIGNIRGSLSSQVPGAKTLIIASHIDTVINAGKYDGPLGVLAGLDMIEHLIESKTTLPFHIELIAFCDEEGVRFHTTYLGSKVVAGSFDNALLDKTDKDNISLRQVIENAGGKPNLLANDALTATDLFGYFELHIEQGPVLYESGDPVAIVTAIAGQKRIELIFTGVAGHAGTVPMDKRSDALCCAAAAVTAIEAYACGSPGIVATVGQLTIPNSASNVIPGQVTCTLDIRSADETRLAAACTALRNMMQQICDDRNIDMQWRLVQETAPVACDGRLITHLAHAVKAAGFAAVELVSGAGHDAVPLSAVCPVCMLFIRCYKGISHNPLEDVELKDIAAAIQVADNFLLSLASPF